MTRFWNNLHQGRSKSKGWKAKSLKNISLLNIIKSLKHVSIVTNINLFIVWGLVWFYGVQSHFQQYFSYIVAVCFIGGGYWSEYHRPVASH
jgi:hypothetical protein